MSLKAETEKDLISWNPDPAGLLTGVYCYAGYLPQQQDAPFVILLNQPQNNRDEILQILMAGQNTKTTLTARK